MVNLINTREAVNDFIDKVGGTKEPDASFYSVHEDCVYHMRK